MQKKRDQSNCFSGILFLLAFFFSLNLFSAKLAPESRAADTSGNISATVLLQTDAVQPQPASFDHTPIPPADPLFSPACAIETHIVSFARGYVYEGPDTFCRFFHFHHSAYGEEPPVSA